MGDSDGRNYEPPELNKYGDLEEMTKGMGQTGLDTSDKRSGTGGGGGGGGGPNM